MSCRVSWYRNFFAVGIVVVSGCGGDVVCTLQPRPAVGITIVDSLTGAPAAYGASLILQGRTVYDSTVFGPERYAGDSLTLRDVGSNSSGQGGTYTVRVRRAGYRLWQQAGVHVDGDACGADEPATLVARLQRGS